MSSFTDAVPPFDGDGFAGYDNQQFNSFSNFDSPNSVKGTSSFTGDSSPVHGSQGYSAVEGVFTSSQPIPETSSPPSIYSSGGGGVGGGFSAFSLDQNGNEGFGSSEGAILPGPEEMGQEKSYALREWRRLNAIQLEEKEKREKEMRQQIVKEAEEFKAGFYKKRQVTVENNKTSNREKEMQFAVSREKFHAEADKNYWKAIGELIPREVPAIEKRGKKDKEKKPSVVVIQGPKPGKPTDLSRMRHILLKLKHNPPLHMKPKPLQTAEPKQDAKASLADGSGTSEPPLNAPAATKPVP